RDDQRGLRGQAEQHARQLGPGALVALCRPGGLRLSTGQPERPQGPQVVAKRVRVATEYLDGLERAKRRVQLRGMPVERVERLPYGLPVVSLVAQRQILEPRQRRERRIG